MQNRCRHHGGAAAVGHALSRHRRATGGAALGRRSGTLSEVNNLDCHPGFRRGDTGVGALRAGFRFAPRGSHSNRKSCGKNAAALDNAIEKYYLRFHDRSDAG
jgi:hypothetical protein